MGMSLTVVYIVGFVRRTSLRIINVCIGKSGFIEGGVSQHEKQPNVRDVIGDVALHHYNAMTRKENKQSVRTEHDCE